MKPEEKIIEGEVSETGAKPKKESTELTVKPENNQPALIVGENSVEVATKVANALKDVVEKQQLYSMITGKKYVKVEGWNTLGALMGVFPEVVSVEKLPARKVKLFKVQQTKSKKNYQTQAWETYTIMILMNPAFFEPTNPKMVKLQEIEFDEIAYKATVCLKTVGGDLISKAEAFCSNLEESKYKNDEYAINSMAQTRATGKAFRIAFSWIMAMAGYEATPAEEMPADGFDNHQEPTQPARKPAQSYANDEPRYESYMETPPAPAPATKPWQNNPKWTPKATQPAPVQNQTRPSAPSAQFECCGCGAVIPQVVKDYAMKFYGDPLCRECQKNGTKIR